MSKESQPSYYAIIPANVRYANINANAKLLYGEITALANQKGYCWANNQYFANLYGVNKWTISKWIAELKDNQFIEVETKPQKGQQVLRKITMGVAKNHNGGFAKNHNGGFAKNHKHNNTSMNNTSMNNTYNNKKQEKKEVPNQPQEPSPDTCSQEKNNENYLEPEQLTETYTTNQNKDLLSLQGSEEKELKYQSSPSPRSSSLGEQSGRDDHKTKQWLKDLAEDKRPKELFDLCGALDQTDQEIKQSAEKALDWLDSNGKRKKDYRAFLRNWVRREYPDKDKKGYKRQNMERERYNPSEVIEGKGLM